MVTAMLGRGYEPLICSVPARPASIAEGPPPAIVRPPCVISSTRLAPGRLKFAAHVPCTSPGGARALLQARDRRVRKRSRILGPMDAVLQKGLVEVYLANGDSVTLRRPPRPSASSAC